MKLTVVVLCAHTVAIFKTHKGVFNDNCSPQTAQTFRFVQLQSGELFTDLSLPTLHAGISLQFTCYLPGVHNDASVLLFSL